MEELSRELTVDRHTPEQQRLAVTFLRALSLPRSVSLPLTELAAGERQLGFDEILA